MTDLFQRFAPAIMELPAGRTFTKEELLTDTFRLMKEGRLEMYYAPRSASVSPHAKVAVIGITPGWTEMELSFRIARNGLAAGLTPGEIKKQLKVAAHFAGATRANMVAMLDRLGLQHALGIAGCAELFGTKEHLLHTTAMWGYPVFAGGKNYNGHTPPLRAAPMLRQRAVDSLGAELAQMQSPLLIPLGKTVEQVVRLLVEDRLADAAACLWGFPHPSGANGHRHSQFAAHFDSMRSTIACFERRASPAEISPQDIDANKPLA